LTGKLAALFITKLRYELVHLACVVWICAGCVQRLQQWRHTGEIADTCPTVHSWRSSLGN